ncbi:hypothetical protein D0B54_20190 [Solimonas sp. K1W22B-7]|uniref:toxin-antitoxin system YwqK family antitoxin n=1 Tax=Solimonas sp. K1W22B-7 TaxID=2303331 RepID=UPI000E3328A2|nr:hypothetical protein [Solimonas sp. K1W22B-7]AXQ30860.1 hypothetical protein D0B54_20190 [Solimonas sp. K1W22B-7]
MSVFFRCLDSRLRINKAEQPAARATLLLAAKAEGHWRDELTASPGLPEALRLLGCECHVSSCGDIERFEPDEKIDTDGHDEFSWMLPVLAPYIADGSYLLAEYDDETCRTEFQGGRYREVFEGGDCEDDGEGAARATAWRDAPRYAAAKAQSARADDVDLLAGFTGMIESRPEDLIGHRVHFVDGKLQGQQTFLQASGAVLATVDYEQGEAHGVFNLYSSKGSLALTATFSRGLLEGEMKILDNDGSLTASSSFAAGKYHGPQLIFEAEGSARIHCEYRHGVPHGRFFAKQLDGRVMLNVQFADGEPQVPDEGRPAGWADRAKAGAGYLEQNFNWVEKLPEPYHKPEWVLQRVRARLNSGKP